MSNRVSRKITLKLSRKAALAVFLPFLVLHCAWIVPVVEWSCLCPDDDPHWNCCCNCPKCVERRGGFKSYCHLRPSQSCETEIRQGVSLPSPTPDGHAHDGILKPVHVSLETIGCECSSHIKKISLDVHAFIPQATALLALVLPVASIIPRDDRRPPEAIPCQPDVPG